MKNPVAAGKRWWKQSSCPEVAAFICAVAGIAIAVTALYGWAIRSKLLIQMNPDFAPMQFNSAVSILFLSAALLCVSQNHAVKAYMFLVIPVLVALGTLEEYVFANDLRIDNPFFEPFVSVINSHPKRMAPNTALSTMFLSLAIVIANRKKFSTAFFLTGLFSGVVTVALPSLALLGYVTDLGSKFGWVGLTRMGVNTAVCLVTLATANLALWRGRIKSRSPLTWDGLSFVTVIVGFAVSILLWQTMMIAERSNVEEQLSNEALTIKSELTSQLNSHVSALRRMGDRWESRGGTPYEEWANDAANYIRDQPAYLAISWVDASSHLRWVEPLKGNESFVGYDLSKEAERHATLERARTTRRPSISRNITLLSGGNGFILAVPLFIGDRFDGFIIGAFRTPKFVQASVYHKERGVHSVTISENGKEIYEQNIGDRANEGFSVEPVNVDTHDLNWNVKVWFEPENVPPHGLSPQIALAAGLLLTLLLSKVLQLRRRSDDHARQLEATHKALYLQTKEFRNAFDYASHGMAIVSLTGTWVKVNRALCSMFGYTEEELLAKTFQELTHPEDLHKNMSLAMDALAGTREAYQMEKRYLHKNGQIIWVMLSVSLVRDEQNGPVHFIAQIQDITAEKEAEAALKDAASFRQTLLDSAKYGIISTDLSGIIQTFNRAAENMLGYSRSDVVGISTPAPFHFENEMIEAADRLSAELARPIKPGFEVFVAKLHEGYRVIDAEWTYVRKDGSTFPISLSCTALKDHVGKIVGYMGVAEDISDRKRTEDELAQARDKAMAATEAKSQFLANTSHEIRTPLTSVIGFAETILLGGLTVVEHKQAVESIIRNGKHLLRVLNDILDFSKIEAGKMDLELIQTDLFSLLSDVGNMMRHKADETSNQLSFDYAYPLPTVIRTDPTRLKQILFNLISNALKFTQNGSVTVHVKFIPDSEHIEFAVKDTGIGLTEEQQSRLFQAFSQADTATTRQFGGTGLGLVISSQLARKMGGTITLHSEKGIGSTFTAIVSTGTVAPEAISYARPAQLFSATSPSLETAQHFSGKVLLVEDGPDNQQYISFVLRKVGTEVTICENGAEAISAVEKQEFDLILMDVQMPVMDGHTATRLLRQRGYTKPIVALTANILKVDIDKSLSAGCDDYLGKPFERSAFLEKLSLYLKKSSSDEIGPRSLRATEYIEDDPEMLKVFLSFIERLPVRLETINKHFEDGNREEVGSCAHQLKGAAGNLGYSELSEAASLLESTSLKTSLELDEPVAQLRAIIQSMTDESDRLRRFASSKVENGDDSLHS